MSYSSRLSAFCDKVIEAGWLVAVIVVPLFFNVYSSRVFEPDKLTTLRSIALIMVGAWFIKWLEERRQPKQNQITWRTPLILPTLLLVGVYVLSSILSIVPYVSVFGSYQRMQGLYTFLSYVVVFWMIVMNMRRREQLDRIITIIVMTSLPIAMYGMIQRIGKDPLPWGGDVTQRVAANMGNAIFVAAYLIMAFFLTLGRVVQSFRVILTEQESRISDILRAATYVLIASVQGIAFLFANSRGPILGMGAGGFVFVLVSFLMLRTAVREQGQLTVRKFLVAVAAALIATGLGAVAGYFIVGPLLGRGDPLASLEWSILGAIGGGVILILLLTVLRRTWGWLWLSWVSMALIAIAILGVINLAHTQRIQDLRQTQIIGPLARLLESESGTGKVRTLIWQGAVQLILPHGPLDYPDGTPDGLNFLRPIVGYGPESMYVAYNRFYPPDLAHYEARNASPDRSHNETFDTFVTTGVIGFLAEQFLFISVFYFGLKWLGLMRHRLAKYLFVGFWIGGALLGSIGLMALKGTNFLGVGVPGGGVAGMVLYLIVYSLFLYRAEDVEEGHGHQILIVALLAAILAHYLEINFGIAIAATRLYFFTFAGLLVVAGLHFVPADDEQDVKATVPAPVAVEAKPAEPVNVPRNKKKSRRVATAAAAPAKRETRRYASNAWLSPVISFALLGALILGTLGYEFINSSPNASPVSGAVQLISNSLTKLPYQNNEPYAGALLMFGATWIFGGILALAELRRRNTLTAHNIPWALATYYGVSLGVAFLFWLIIAGQLLSLSSLIKTSQINTLQDLAQRDTELLTLADAIGNMISLYYLLVFGIMFGLAAALFFEVRQRFTNWGSDWGLVATVPLAIAVLVVMVTTNLNFIRADIVYKQAEAMRSNGQWDIAVDHYKYARELNPNEDFYDLWLGAAFLEKATNASTSAPSILTGTSDLNSLLGLDFIKTYQLNQKDTLTVAQAVLEYARQLNPLNTDHTANLARLHRRWADLYASDPAARQKELETAADFYRQATSLSPNNAQLWNEWATVLITMADQARQNNDAASANTYLADAQAKLDHSMQLDQLYDQTYLIAAQLARSEGKTDQAQQLLSQALAENPGNSDAWINSTDLLVQQGNYTDAEKITLAFLQANPNSLPALRTLARNIYYPQNRLSEAIATQQQVVQLDSGDANQWDDERVLAYFLAQVGQLQQALTMAQQALSHAPQDKQAEVKSLVDQLQAQISGAPQPNTPPAPTPTPAQ